LLLLLLVLVLALLLVVAAWALLLLLLLLLPLLGRLAQNACQRAFRAIEGDACLAPGGHVRWCV
jgi:hypothetical protein